MATMDRWLLLVFVSKRGNYDSQEGETGASPGDARGGGDTTGEDKQYSGGHLNPGPCITLSWV